MDYPRPQLERDSFFCLDGEWEFAHCAKGAHFAYDRVIRVPFSPESRASGIGDFVLQPGGEIHYRKAFRLPGGFVRDRLFLNFGAVDYECACLVNGRPVGSHRGGYLPFSFDITASALPGENVVELSVTDPTDSGVQSRGKQRLKRGGIWYTPQSGIWQTVWLESVARDYVSDLRIVPDIDTDTVRITVCAASPSASVRAFDGDRLIARADSPGGDEPRADGTHEFVLSMAGCEYWSPENPKLYGLVVSTPTDEVRSYFGMRKFSVGSDGRHRRLFLNNKPYFHRGLLDQGYWPEGLLTPPGEDAVVRELELVKKMGFNMLRKHIKIESLRWYFHCDRLGIIVWQDFVCGGGPYEFLKVGLLPFLGFRFRDGDYGFMGRRDRSGREEFVREMGETVSLLKNCVGLGVWVLFNEGWGQFDSVELTARLRKLDGTRTIDSVSGWHDQGKETSELKSLHTYYTALAVPARETRAVALSEFGGYSLKVPGHVFDEKKSFGYRVFRDAGGFREAYRELIEDRLLPLLDRGLCASVYTQLSDVEEEINGLVTYDRSVIKLDVGFIRALNERLSYLSDGS